ncbi:hypothetical protein TNCV_637691 [Trichonephila clavipes]|nr:hypothetical protein TNCV_637691 [Trichonephila clavipes]
MDATYSMAIKDNRFPMKLLFAEFNVATISARIILLSSQKPLTRYRSRHSCLKFLGFQLTQEYEECKNQNNQRFSRNLKEKLRLGKDNGPPVKKAN